MMEMNDLRICATSPFAGSNVRPARLPTYPGPNVSTRGLTTGTGPDGAVRYPPGDDSARHVGQGDLAGGSRPLARPSHRARPGLRLARAHGPHAPPPQRADDR